MSQQAQMFPSAGMPPEDLKVGVVYTTGRGETRKLLAIDGAGPKRRARYRDRCGDRWMPLKAFAASVTGVAGAR